MMKTLNGRDAKARARQTAFSLVEVMVAVAVLGLLLTSLGGGLVMAFSYSQLNDENLRATQILTEKMDLIRACSWDQVANSSTFIPSTFSAPFYNPVTNDSPTFQGTVTIANAPITESYSSSLRRVTVTVTWISGSIQRSRSMSTFVSAYGIQNYSF